MSLPPINAVYSNNPEVTESVSTDTEHEPIEMALLAEGPQPLTHADIRKKKLAHWMDAWWKIHEAEDAEEKEDKTARKLERIGPKQYAVLATTCAAVTALQFIYKDEPIMKGTTGASMNAIKISYIQMAALKDTRVPQNVMRVIALTTFAAAMIFRYVPEDPYGVIPVLRSLPLTDVALAVFAKCDLNSLKLDKKVIDGFKACFNVELPATPTKTVTLLGQAAIMGVLMSVPNIVGNDVATGAATLKKAQWRRLTDILMQAVDRIEHPVKRKIAIGTAVSSSVALTAACIYAATTPLFQNNPYISWIPVAVGLVTFDAASRFGKQVINAYDLSEEDEDIVEPPPTFWSRCSSVLQTLGLVGATVGISAVVGPKMIHPPGENSLATAPGTMVSVIGEAAGYLKTLAGKVTGKSTAALATTVATVAVGTGVYLARNALGIDRYTTPGYGAALFGIASVFTTALYLNKALLKAPKKAKAAKIELAEV